MRYLKWLLAVAVALALIVIGGGYLLPASVHVERSAVLRADAGQIFPHINSLRRFHEWSPWAERDPNMKLDFAGPEEGIGARMSWASDKDEVGSGSQEIVESTANERVVTALDFGDMGKARASFQLQPEEVGTKIIWALDSELPANPFARWFGLFLDGMVGPDYETGLKRLKAKVETPAAAGG
jgi:hypothetical protein